MTTLPYHHIPDLENIYLEDSFVITVRIRPSLVEVLVDFVLREGHADYAEPDSESQYCYRRGALRFDGVDQMSWNMPKGPPAVDASGETDYGGLDSYTIESGTHRLVGEIGELEIVCDRVRVFLADLA